MKAWRVHEWGPPESMVLDDIPIGPPGPGEVVIRHKAAGLNFFDALQIAGQYQVKPAFPFTPGAEASGIVESTGPGFSRVKPGDRVVALLFGGGFADHSVVNANNVYRIPDKMPFEEAAGLILVYHTAWFALRTRALLQEGEWLLVHAGASGVGMAAIQLGKAWGARIIATASSDEKRAFCREQGADYALDYSKPSWVDDVKQITNGDGADVIFDPVGGDIFDLSTKCVAAEGRILIVGFAGGSIPTVALNRVLLKDISVVGVHWGPYAAANPGYLDLVQSDLEELYLTGKIRPVIGAMCRLAEIPSALERMTARGLIGKSIAIIE